MADSNRPRWCNECSAFNRHNPHCSKATIDDYFKALEKALKDEEWSRKRARHWLDQCRLMHGKIAMLKAENNKLRRKAEDREQPQW